MAVVSVIMPSYNHAAFIGEAIRSVLAQTLDDIELIVIDDGSTDATADVIRSFADPRIRAVFRDCNVGSAQGTNEGLRLARAPFVAMISSDDCFEPRKLETQLRVFHENDAVTAVFCRPRIIDAAGREYEAGTHRLQAEFPAGRWRQPEILRRLFLQGNFLCHPSAMVRRETYDRVGLHDERMSSLGDFDMWMRMAVACDGDFVVLDEPLMSFRVHGGNTSGPTRANLQCGENEWPLIAEHLEALRAKPAVFAAAFPEMAATLRGAPEDLEYAVSRLAVKHPVRSVRAFGIRRLYEMMSDESVARRLANAHGFTTRDLIRMSQETDTTGVGPVGVGFERGAAGGRPVTPRPPRFLQRVARETSRVARQVQALAVSTSRTLGGAKSQSRWKPGYTRITREPMDCGEAGAVAKRYLENRARTHDTCGLHLGCGDHPLAGWLNVDLGGKPDVFWDLTAPLEWAPDAAFDVCFSEHVLEHFARPIGVTILREAFRSLRPGGVLRIAIPDLASVVRMYSDDAVLDVPNAEKDVLVPTAIEARALYGSSYGTRGERLNVGMHGWGHAYLYDEEDLIRVFADAGFSGMRRCRHSESARAPLRGIETRPEFQSALVVEGVKE